MSAPALNIHHGASRVTTRQLLAPGARAWAPVAGVRGRLLRACVGCGRAWASCCGRAFASCWACRLCVWKLQQCCCSVLLFKTHWKEVPAIAVCFGSQGLAEVDQTWTQRGPNVDPNETKSRKKLLFYFFVVSPSLSLSLSLAVASWRLSAPTAAHFQQKGVQPNTYCIVR